MKGFRGFGVSFLNVMPTRELVGYAKIADQEGLDQFWFAEGYQWWRRMGYANTGSISTLTAAAVETERIKIGTGIISPYTRHPSVIAMEATSLHEISKGRFLLGLGATKTALTQHGISMNEARPMVTMKECIQLVRLLLSGQPVSYHGRIFSLECPEAPAGAVGAIPIYTGPTGPQMLKLSGEMADGALLTTLVTPEYTQYATKIIHEGAKLAGRRLSELDVGAFLITSCDRDGEAARDEARRLVSSYLANKDFGKIHPDLMSRYGFEEAEISEVKQAALRGDVGLAARLLPDHILENVAVVGTPEECIKRIKDYVAAGVSTPIAYQVIGPDRRKSLRLIAREVVPALRD